jgi:hypothetical protein
MNTPPKQMTVCQLEVLVMPNGEVLCGGTTIGLVKTIGKYLTPFPVPERPTNIMARLPRAARKR